MTVKLLTEHNFEFLSLKGDYTGSSESTLVKCHIVGKSHVTAHMSHFFMCEEFLMRLRICTGSSEPLLLTYGESTAISCAGPYILVAISMSESCAEWT